MSSILLASQPIMRVRTIRSGPPAAGAEVAPVDLTGRCCTTPPDHIIVVKTSPALHQRGRLQVWSQPSSASTHTGLGLVLKMLRLVDEGSLHVRNTLEEYWKF